MIARTIAEALTSADRVRLAEARRLIASLGDTLWPGWHAAPMALLLVKPAQEVLLWHDTPTPDFVPVGYDSLLATRVLVRPTQFSPELLATFPAVNGVPTIVIGTAEQTKRRSTSWVLIIAHEHFHQWQYSQPAYYPRANALDLANAGSQGSWMLNYPFPYDSAKVAAAFADFAATVRGAVRDSSSRGASAYNSDMHRVRDQLRDAVSPADYRYLTFQLWQEGMARYTEYSMGQLAARWYTPTAAFSQLADFEPFADAEARMRRNILQVEDASLTAQHRVAFYPIGAALGLWLDRSAPGWRARYLHVMFAVDSLYPARSGR